MLKSRSQDGSQLVAYSEQSRRSQNQTGQQLQLRGPMFPPRPHPKLNQSSQVYDLTPQKSDKDIVVDNGGQFESPKNNNGSMSKNQSKGRADHQLGL